MEQNGIVITAIIATAAVTWLLLFPVRGLLRRAGVVDKPNARSSHTVPTVRGGGVAIVVVVIAALIWLAFREQSACPVVLLCAFGLLAIVSFIDDLRGLPARARFAVQVLCAVAAVVSLTTNSSQPITIPGIGLGLLAVTWLSGYTNAFNFMDGINGIAGMQALVTGVGTAFIALRLNVAASDIPVALALVVVSAALGFLPHNFPRARVFMGDVSSAPLGFLLAVLAFWVAQLTSWWVMFWIGLLHANFVLDTAITLLRRAVRGDKLSQPHREHFYQRLVRAGYSHTFVTLTEFALQCVVVVALWWATPAGWGAKATVAAGVFLMWGAFFAFAEREFRRAMRRQQALAVG